MNSRTIVALATPPGEGGLAVIRLSGPEAVAVAGRVFTGAGFPDKVVSHRAVYGILKRPTGSHPTNSEIDRCLALPMLAPRSYTGEDTVEFHCHGGRAVARMAVAACCEAGAEPALPGEFTRRAFLNGKLSLDQAEAVADLIGARGEQAARAALAQLRGGLDRELASVETPLLELLARIEGGFEFLDEEGVELEPAEVASVLAEAVARIDGLLAMAPAGRLLRDGVQIALTGRPNVGKSSLFNRLLGEDRAIVDDEAGTTRDVVSARLVRGGVLYELHDTAGLRDAAGRVENKGMARSRRSAADADLVLALADAGEPEVPATDAPVVRVRTKADLEPATPPTDGIATSSRDGRGVEELWSEIESIVARSRLAEAAARGVVLNERHRHRLRECAAELRELGSLVAGEPPLGPEITGTMLAAILGRLGEVSGRVFTENLLNTVFKRFCVGK